MKFWWSSVWIVRGVGERGGIKSYKSLTTLHKQHQPASKAQFLLMTTVLYIWNNLVINLGSLFRFSPLPAPCLCHSLITMGAEREKEKAFTPWRYCLVTARTLGYQQHCFSRKSKPHELLWRKFTQTQQNKLCYFSLMSFFVCFWF